MAEVPDILRRICEQRRRRVYHVASDDAAAGVPVAALSSSCGASGRAVPAGLSAFRDPEAVTEAVRSSASGVPEALSPRGLPAGSPGRRFLEAIEVRRGRAVIAEIKMGSPKLGDLRGRFDPVARAATYAAAGAACLSVVVEPDSFYGSYELLADCAAASGLPAVAKDFVVSDAQLEWARVAGASAVLLIAALHDAAELRRLAALARGLGLVPLIETHDDEDFEKLRSADGGESAIEPAGMPPRIVNTSPRDRPGGDAEWELVGINNRDLRTFEVDLERSADRVGRLPASALKVAESGIRSGADVARLRRAGFDAFLIGERLVLSGDPAAALAELLEAPPRSPASTAMSRRELPPRAART